MSFNFIKNILDKKIIIKTLFVVFAFGLVFFSFWKDSQKMVAPEGYIWSEYENKKYGFVIVYPIDIAHPREIRHPKSDNGFSGADTVVFFDENEQQKIIFLWIQPIHIDDIDVWFEPMGSDYYISTTTMIAGENAIGYKEKIQGKGAGSFNLHFIKDGYLYSLYIHIDDQRVIEYIKQNFKFIK